jgi:hypothetical protein
VLLRTLFLLFLFAALGETLVHGAHALAQVTLRREAAVAVHTALLRGVAEARTAIAGAIAAGADPRAVSPVAPAPAATCTLGSSNGCALQTTVKVSFALAPAATASPCASGWCTVYRQGNDEVDEGRIEAAISAESAAAGGQILASRAERIAFRTWRVAPYAALVGDLDSSVEALAPAGQGDDGGAPPSGAAPGTLIDVTYENRNTGASMPANVWQPDVQRPAAVPPPWSP